MSCQVQRDSLACVATLTRELCGTYGGGVTDDARQPEKIADLEKTLDEKIGPRWVYWDLRNAAVGAEVMARYTKSDMGREVLSGIVLLSDVITADMLRRVPVSFLEQGASLQRVETLLRKELDSLPPLQRTPDQSPEDFSRLVAEHYKVWAMYSATPAASMAAESNVKAPTVHTWIREARLRGLLPPARRGKTT